MSEKGAYYLGKERTYGGGYCGVCGHTGEELVPRLVRWWDCDDGWKVGVLCEGCFEYAEDNPPKERDFAYRADDNKSALIDTAADVLGDDTDGIISTVEDLL